LPVCRERFRSANPDNRSERRRYRPPVARNVADAVPAHLRRFVVEQNYGQYNAVDRAVWRFLLLQTQARLRDTAHPAYHTGHAAAGITPDRIPLIADVNDRLSRFGWGAVCVDGFIPPRAFQEFQACGLLPIAAELRTREQLEYTPAPDIFHEAAGHAPILPDPIFAAYLRRIGDLGRKAFTVPEENDLDEAIHVLSERKGDPGLAPGEIARAEAALAAVLARLPEASEAARLARLYWWTAEYGLVGRPDDYKIYGAGLLSSLRESQTCHGRDVAKVALDERCMDVAYDITRPQPRLFVAPSFETLHDVLDRAARQLAINVGGETALRRAVQSRALASIRFSSGAWVIGVLADAGPTPARPAWLELAGPVGFAWEGIMQPEHERLGRPAGAIVITGALAGGGRLERASERDIDAARERPSGRHRFRFANGAEVTGTLQYVVRRDGLLMRIELGDAELRLPACPPRRLSRHVLLPAGEVVTAHAGAVDARFHPDTAFPGVYVPVPRRPRARERRSIALYGRIEAAVRGGRVAMRDEFPRILAAQRSSEPLVPRPAGDGERVDWLLRWVLLDGLVETNAHVRLTHELRNELERLEAACA
jgi:phenylalanine-4-hydroxylase